jgi:Mrp family chromosome partitioning ATPase
MTTMRTIEKPNYSVVPAGEAGPEIDAESRNLPPGLLATAVRAPLRRWPLSLAGILVGAAFAVLAGLAFSEKSWKAEGVLVYSPVPLPESRKGSYSPQKLETLIAIIKATSDLETLRQEFDLAMTVEVLNKKIKVEQEPRSEKVSVSLEWGDRDTGTAIVNRLMELHTRHVNSIQKGKTTEMMLTLQSQLQEYQTSGTAARQELVEFLSKKDIIDIEKERARLDRDIAEADKNLTEARDKIAEFPQRFRELDEQSTKLNNDLQSKSLADLAKAAEEDRDYRKRRKDLEDNSREEERHRSESEKEFRAADQEARSVEPLLRTNAISRSEATKLRATADLLRLKVQNSERKLKDMAEDINQLPRDYFLAKAADLRKKRSDLQEEVRSKEAKIGQLEESANVVRERKGKRLVVLAAGSELEKKYKELDSRRLQCEEQLSDLRTLGSEVKIDTPATPQRDPFASNFKKLAAMVFVAPMGLFFSGMVLFDVVSNLGTARTLARRLKLPVLGRFPAPGKAAVPAESRALALRLRQSVAEPGAVLLVTPLSGRSGVNELVCDVTRYLALQDEKVLILDGRIGDSQEMAPPPWVSPLESMSNGTSTGLVQYLVFDGQSVWDSILPTRLPGVEYLPAGGPCSTTDVLASQQMRDLLQTLRQHYSLIVIAGPSADHPIDTEILSGYADGVLAVVGGSAGAFPPDAEELVRSLQDAGAPLLGAVVCE